MIAPKLGHTATNPELRGRRDAHHVSCVLAACDEALFPGTEVRFCDAAKRTVRRADRSDMHGIVDPFLEDVTDGKLFWVLLLPELVSGLRHHFEIETSEREIKEVEEHVARYMRDDDGCSGSWCGDN